MDSHRIPARQRALGLWARCWQLAGGQWPPASRAIAHQIVMMVAGYLYDAARADISRQDAFQMAHEALSDLYSQRFYPGGEQDIAVERLHSLILDVEIGDLDQSW